MKRGKKSTFYIKGGYAVALEYIDESLRSFCVENDKVDTELSTYLEPL